MMHTHRFRFALLAAGLVLASTALAQRLPTRLMVNGTVASTSVRVTDGRAYSPIADGPKALDMQVVERPGA